MGYPQAFALLGAKTQTYIAAAMVSKRLDTPNSLVSAVVEGLSKATIDGMDSGALCKRMPGLDVVTPVAIEALLVSGTVPATADTFEAALP
jgi:hypothetical protein